MLTPEEQALRRQCITATDARRIAAVDPFGTAHDVFAEKMGIASRETTFAMKLGLRVEAVVMDLLADERGLELVQGTTGRHRIFDWVGATPDRIVLEKKSPVAVAEGKNVGLRMMRDWDEDDDAPPEYVHVQAQWQMTATGLKKCYVAALLGGSELRIFEIEHSPDLETALLEICDAFWRRHVLTQTPPPPDASESTTRMLKGLFPKNVSGMIAAGPEASALARAFFEAEEDEVRATLRKDQAKHALQLLIGENEGLLGEGWRATWKKKASNGVDWKGIAESFFPTPDTLAKFTREGSRMFLCKRAETRRGRAA